jgi:hypothetical protein
MSRRYNVGQVLYVISTEHNKVLPFQVIEEITKKTLRGDEIFYKVVYGTDQTKTKLLSEIKDEIFTSLEDVRNHLMQNVTTWVNTQVEAARKAANTWYKTPDPTGLPDDMPSQGMQPSLSDPHTVNTEDGDTNLVELPDGRVVKARIKGVQK